MMADKKIARSRRERSLTPTEKLVSALSDSGTISMVEAAHDKGKSALFDKFRRREDRWRQEQALRDQEAAQEGAAARQTGEDGQQSAERGGPGEGSRP